MAAGDQVRLDGCPGAANGGVAERVLDIDQIVLQSSIP